MKRICILIILVVGLANNYLSGQELKYKEEIMIHNNIYIYESYRLYRKDSKLKDLSTRRDCEHFNDEEYPNNLFNDIIIKVFSKGRLEEFTSKSRAFLIELICNQKGDVLEVIYVITRLGVSEQENENSLSFNEIDQLEKELKKYKVKLSNTCPDVSYYTIYRICKFADILKYLNKKNE